MESLHNDVDYRSRLSRAKVETAIESSLPLFSSPINTALRAANLSISDLTSVILFGGNTRVPLVQSAVRAVLGDAEDRIAQNVNTDEAAVLGAAYYGAALSRQFKMKSLNVTEAAMEPFMMAEEMIFQKGTRLGTRKSLALPPRNDLVVEFAQGS